MCFLFVVSFLFPAKSSLDGGRRRTGMPLSLPCQTSTLDGLALRIVTTMVFATLVAVTVSKATLVSTSTAVNPQHHEILMTCNTCLRLQNS